MVGSMKTLADLQRFEVEDIVFHRAGQDGRAGIVYGLIVLPAMIKYLVSWGDGRSDEHFDVELTAEKPF